MFNNNILSVRPSATADLISKVAEYKRKGEDVIQFNVGEPDLEIAKNIRDVAIESINNAFTKYTAVAGIYELRESICKKLDMDNGLVYSPEEIIVTIGAKQAIANALLTLCNKGDEVIIFTPCWVSYIEMAKIAGANPVLVETLEDEGFLLNILNLRKAITDRTKVIILNTPNNPTGAVYTKESLEELADIAVKNNIYVIADEIYEKLVYEGSKHYSIGSFNEDIKRLTLTVNGFSKAYGMTGWRIGYVAANVDFIKQMNKLQGHTTTSTNSMAQKAAVEALIGPQDCVENMVKEYSIRRKYLFERLNKMKGVVCINATGAFYLVPNISSFYGKKYGDVTINDSYDMANYLLDYGKIAVVPGAAFEMPQNIRISYSNTMKNIELGMDKMEEALKKLS